MNNNNKRKVSRKRANGRVVSMRNGKSAIATDTYSGRTTVFRTPIVSDRVIVDLPYVEFLQRTSVAVSDEYVYTGNGIFDPNVTGGGGQPMGFDEWCGFYLRHRVIGATISVELSNLTASPLHFTIFPSLLSTGAANIQEAMAQPYNTRVNVGGISAYPIATLDASMSSSKIWGQNVNFDDLFAGSNSANPTRLWYWVLNAFNADNATLVVYTILVKITYKTVFWDRAVLAMS